MEPGKAADQGMANYARLFPDAAPGHFRTAQGLTLSSIGLGTYLGDPTDEYDDLYAKSAALALTLGCNVFDAAVNYRFQRSERAVGRAIAQSIADGFSREQIVVCTKGGFISYDTDYPGDASAWIQKTYIEPGIIRWNDIVARQHCMAPAYLAQQIALSRRNLRVETIDVYYVHNPETQLMEIGEEEFYRRLGAAFELLEAERDAGHIRWYGIATWYGFLSSPAETDRYMSMERVVATARRIAGEKHHMKFIQLPVNLGMPQAIAVPNQFIDGNAFTALDAAAELGLTAIGSASMLQARLASGLPDAIADAFPDAKSDAQRAIQFARSAPGVTTALVGMSNPEHVRHNLELAQIPPLLPHHFANLIESGRE